MRKPVITSYSIHYTKLYDMSLGLDSGLSASAWNAPFYRKSYNFV